MADLMAIVLFVIALILGVLKVRGADISGEEDKIKISDIANSSHPPGRAGLPGCFFVFTSS
jgi:hypothetical protein